MGELELKVHYGKATLVNTPYALYGPWSPREILNDALGVLRDDDKPYATMYLGLLTYGPLLAYAFQSRSPDGALEVLDDEIYAALHYTAVRFASEGMPAAAGGTFPLHLAEALARVRHTAPDAVAVPDFEALFAWAVQELVSRGPVSFVKCGNCQLPFVPSGRGERYCSRPAPRQMTPCRVLVGMRRYAQKSKKGDESHGNDH